MEKLLNQLGLGPKEQTIYKLVLERGKVAPALLSRLTGINRTTVYSVANELKDKGLLLEDLGGKTLYYLPTREHELDKIIKTEREKLEQKESIIRELKNILKSLPQSQTYSVPKIRFIEGSDVGQYFKESLPRWIGSVMTIDTTWWGFQDHTLVEEFESIIDHSWNIAPKEMNVRLLTNDSKIEKNMEAKQYAGRRHLKYLNDDQFSATQWIAGDYVIFVMTRQKPFYLVEIHDSVMAHNMREVFKKLWEKTL